MPRGDIRVELVPAIRGIRTDLPRHLVPDGYFTAGSNVILRSGATIVRPGFTPVVSGAPFTVRVMGLVYYRDHTDTARLIAASTGGFALWTGSTWSTITGSALTGAASDQVQFVPFIISNATRLIAVNDVDVPQAYTGTGNFAALGGSPPIAKTVTTAFQRVILGNVTVGGTRRGASLWISGFQDSTSWNADDQVSLTDAGDSIVCVKAWNSQSFAIYMDRSQWVGIGAGNIFPFIFELRDQQPGPVSPNCVVQAENAHYYIGQDGDVFKFDGNKCIAIGTSVRRAIQDDLNFSLQARVHGFYDALNREIWWYWERNGSTTRYGGITYRLPYGEIQGAFSPLHEYAAAISASAWWREISSVTWDNLTGTWDDIADIYPTWDSFGGAQQYGGVIGTSAGQVHKAGVSGGDNGAILEATWEIPFRALAGLGEVVRVDVVESMFKQASSPITVSITLLTSDTMNSDGTEVTAQNVDISGSGKLRATYENTTARFVSVRHSMSGFIGLQEYRGGTIFAYKRGEE